MLDGNRSTLGVQQIDHQQHIDRGYERIVVDVEPIRRILIERRYDLDRYVGDVAREPIVVRDGISEGGGPCESSLWDKQDSSIALRHSGTEVRRGDDVDRAAVDRAIGIEIVGKNIDNDLGIAFGDRRIRDRYRSGVDIDRHGRFLGEFPKRIANAVGEGVLSAETGIGGIADGP